MLKNCLGAFLSFSGQGSVLQCPLMNSGLVALVAIDGRLSQSFSGQSARGKTCPFEQDRSLGYFI